MKYIRALGIDMAFANVGLAHCEIILPTHASGYKPLVRVMDLELIQTEMFEDRKVVRKSSIELRRAKELVAAISKAVERFNHKLVFAEVPSGSQSANAGRALGIALGCLASAPVPIVEVNAMEVKRIVHVSGKGRKMPSKQEMIAYAVRRWSEAPWLLHKSNGKGFKRGDLMNANEHLADALITVLAGLDSEEFKRLLSIMPKHERERRRIDL